MPPSSDVNVAPLTAVMAALDLEPHELQLFDPAYPRFDAQRPLLVLAPQFEAARPLLDERYPSELEARAAVAEGASTASIGSLSSDADAWLLPALTPEQDVRGLTGIRGVVERLFSPDGCPWDQAQTPETLATYFIEEAYELVDAIEGGDASEIREELGDILAHVFMQTAVAQQAGQFTVEDVVEYISRKLVRRHPHVYGDVDSDDPEEIERIWEQIKADERAERTARNPDAAAKPESALDSVPNSAPSLVRSDQLIGRAERAGLGAPPQPSRAQLAAALDALDGTPDTAAVVGALLWAVVRVARDADVDAEQALRATANAFIERFRAVEDEARAANIALEQMPLEQRRRPWSNDAIPGSVSADASPDRAQ